MDSILSGSQIFDFFYLDKDGQISLDNEFEVDQTEHLKLERFFIIQFLFKIFCINILPFTIP